MDLYNSKRYFLKEIERDQNLEFVLQILGIWALRVYLVTPNPSLPNVQVRPTYKFAQKKVDERAGLGSPAGLG